MKDLKLSADENYIKWITSLKERVRSSQLRAAIKVNTELLKLYWDIGQEITNRNLESQWGSKLYSTISIEFKEEFPGVEGFSVSNLKYMKRFFQFYSNDSSIGQQAVDQLKNIYNIPWGHQILLITKCKTIEESMFYMDKILVNGWSRAVLLNFLDTRLYDRQGKAITNFRTLLPEIQSELAQETLKDPYNFDFLTLSEGYKENYCTRKKVT